MIGSDVTIGVLPTAHVPSIGQAPDLVDPVVERLGWLLDTGRGIQCRVVQIAERHADRVQAVQATARITDEVVCRAQVGDARGGDRAVDRLELSRFEEPQHEIGRGLNHVAVDLAGLQLHDDAVGEVVEVPARLDDADVILRLMEAIDDEAPRVAAAGLPPEPAQQFEVDFAAAWRRIGLGEADCRESTPQSDCPRNSRGASEQPAAREALG
jgi:hypothetical protein